MHSVTSRRIRRATLVATMSAIALPAAAVAAPIAGSASERTSDVGIPESDILAAALVYDAEGGLSGGVELAAAPAFPNTRDIAMSVGVWRVKSGECALAGDAHLFPPRPENPVWLGVVEIGDQEGLPVDPVQDGTSVLFGLQAPQVAAQKWNCATAETFGPPADPNDPNAPFTEIDETVAFSLTAQESATPEQPPRCEVQPGRVRRAGKVRFRCANIDGPLRIRFYRGGKLRRAVKARIGAGGRVAVSAKGLRRGAYRAMAWSGGTVPGYGNIRVR